MQQARILVGAAQVRMAGGVGGGTEQLCQAGVLGAVKVPPNPFPETVRASFRNQGRVRCESTACSAS